MLVVEDDNAVRNYSAEILSELGYRVLEASDGPSALEVLKGEPSIRLLFTDLGLPGGIDGRELAQQARRHRPDLAALLTTGYAGEIHVEGDRFGPGVELLPKPFTFSALAVKIRELLDQTAPTEPR
ncbi:response regulator [Microvirga brassicacearum]|uniref:response regulator n=1 Tax=Microvirga brassicacearum TaxID=2580413 RepID=UPI001390D401|nr:response regulator [Microvirga brassicacearum]